MEMINFFVQEINRALRKAEREKEWKRKMNRVLQPQEKQFPRVRSLKNLTKDISIHYPLMLGFLVLCDGNLLD